ncbi:hypothetical protein ACFL2Q_13535 [Thermodesulfobacteriota bacterium]
MPRLRDVTVADSIDLVNSLKAVQGRDTVEEVAQAFTEIMYSRFQESIVLIRLFVTVPFGELPVPNKQSVTALAGSAGITDILNDTTPVLSLLGTQGILPEWNDRRKSEGHVGIPLASGDFIGSIPMMSRMLKELGAALDWIENGDTNIVAEEGLTPFSGTFYVGDAAGEVDQQGRKVIPAQDFVARHDVRTVFGFGGAYVTRTMFATIVVFTRETIEKNTVELLQPIVSAIKAASGEQASQGRIFVD